MITLGSQIHFLKWIFMMPRKIKSHNLKISSMWLPKELMKARGSHRLQAARCSYILLSWSHLLSSSTASRLSPTVLPLPLQQFCLTPTCVVLSSANKEMLISLSAAVRLQTLCGTSPVSAPMFSSRLINGSKFCSLLPTQSTGLTPEAVRCRSFLSQTWVRMAWEPRFRLTWMDMVTWRFTVTEQKNVNKSTHMTNALWRYQVSGL